MKKILISLIVIVGTLFSVAFAPAKTGCLPTGSYIFATSYDYGVLSINWWKMNAGTVSNMGQHIVNLGDPTVPGRSFDVDRCSIYIPLSAQGHQFNIYRIPVKGGWVNQMTFGDEASKFDPLVSPDGSHILFTVLDSVPSLAIMDRSGANQRIIASNVSAPPGSPEEQIWAYRINAIWAGQYDWAKNLRSIAIRPEPGLVAVIFANGNIGIVPIDTNTWMPAGKPIPLQLGHNNFSIDWTNIP